MKPTRLISPPGTYFVTTTTFQRRRFFIVENYARLFLKTLYHYRRQGRFQLHVFVLMPDHFHLLITPAPDVTLERAMQFIKGGYSHAVGQEISHREIWQKGFTDHRIRDAADMRDIACTSIRIRWKQSSCETRLSIAIALRSRDSVWTRGPQRLKPRSLWTLLRPDCKSGPSRFVETRAEGKGRSRLRRYDFAQKSAHRKKCAKKPNGKGATSSRTAYAALKDAASAAEGLPVPDKLLAPESAGLRDDAVEWWMAS